VHQHPHLASQLASERRCDMLAWAQQQCRARQGRAARPAKQAKRRMGRAVRTALRLAGLEQ
jgi:hypothetical protein